MQASNFPLLAQMLEESVYANEPSSLEIKHVAELFIVFYTNFEK